MKLSIWISLALAAATVGCTPKPAPVLDTTTHANDTLVIAAVEHEYITFTNGLSLRTLQPYKYPVGAQITNLVIDPFQGILERASVVIPATHKAIGRCWFAADLDISTPNSAYCAE